MSPCLRYLFLTALACLLPLAGCGNHNAGNPDSGDMAGPDGGGASASYVRVHYQLSAGGDVHTWGMYYYGAGSTSPANFSAPPLLSQTDGFGGYIDIQVTATGDTQDAWLGVIPLLCTNGNCKKDAEQQVRFVDLPAVSAQSHIAECWIVQGQPLQTTKPVTGPPQSKVLRMREFIDLGNGSVRLMFRVPPSSTGTVHYGTDMGHLDQQQAWAATDNINKDGLVLTGLTPGTQIYYQISSALPYGAQMLTDQTPVLSLTPVQFSTIAQPADWASWGRKGLMYEIMVRTFADGGAAKASVADPTKDSGIDPASKDGIGDLVGLKNTLPYLAGLGVDAIWIMPVFAAKSYHGYDTTDFYSIDPAVGSQQDFVDLTTAAHAQGIKILIDLVENHVADVNPWFIKGINPKDADYAKYHEWFVWTDAYENMFTDPHPFDATAVMWACRAYQCYHQIFGSTLPELNFRNPEVRAEMKNIAQHWLALGADGFRLDASKHIDQFDDNNQVAVDRHGTHVWWKEFNYYVKKQVPRSPGAATVILAGENRWDDPAQSSNMIPYAGDMDSQFDFPFRSYLANLVAGKTGDDVDFVKYMNQLQHDAATGTGGNANHFFERFLSNHDLDRPASQFAAAGASLDPLLRQVSTVVMTVPGMPVVFYGEEFGKRGARVKFQDSDSYTHDEFIREPMSWFKSLTFAGDMKQSWNIDFTKTDSANAALVTLLQGAGVSQAPNPAYPFIKFMADGDTYSWAAQKDDAASLFNYYKKLVQIRQANAIITDSATQLTKVSNTADGYEFMLSSGAQHLSVVLSRKAVMQTITRMVMATDLITGAKGTSFPVPPYGALILQ